MVVFEQSGFIRANMAVIGQVCCILKKCFYSCRSDCIRGLVVVFGESNCFRAKVVVFVQSSCTWAKVVVFVQNWLYSVKSGFIQAKVVVFG